jgi:hypothetical protein
MDPLHRRLGLFVSYLLLVAPASLAAANLQITSPATGTVVSPGQTVFFSVTADPIVQQVALFPEPPLPAAQAGSSPNQFILTIPADLVPGPHDLRAIGVAGGVVVKSDYLTIDVERPDDPVRLRTEPAILQLRNRGDRFPLRVIGTYSDGSQAVLTASSRTAYSSNDSTVATVSPSGVVTAVGPGKTSIVVNAPNATYSLQVEVLAAPPTSLFLGNGRFRIDVRWTTSSGSGDGMPVQLTADTGYFWFFNSSNVEIVIKVLNACAFGNHYWVFAGGLTNVQTVITVTDTERGVVNTYRTTGGPPFPPIQDTSAFATCP